MKEILKLPLPPHSPTPASNIVDEDLIEMVKDGIGNIECRYIISTTLPERVRDEIMKILHFSKISNHKSQYIL